jgi:hypothetical protein
MIRSRLFGPQILRAPLATALVISAALGAVIASARGQLPGPVRGHSLGAVRVSAGMMVGWGHARMNGSSQFSEGEAPSEPVQAVCTSRFCEGEAPSEPLQASCRLGRALALREPTGPMSDQSRQSQNSAKLFWRRAPHSGDNARWTSHANIGG